MFDWFGDLLGSVGRGASSAWGSLFGNSGGGMTDLAGSMTRADSGPSTWDKILSGAGAFGKAALPGAVSMSVGALTDRLFGDKDPKIKAHPRSAEQITGDQNKAALSTTMVGEAQKYASDPNYKLGLNDYEMNTMLKKMAATRALTGTLRDSSTARMLNDAVSSYMAQRRGAREGEFAQLAGAANAASSGFSQPSFTHLIPGQKNAFASLFGQYGVPAVWGALDKATDQNTLPPWDPKKKKTETT